MRSRVLLFILFLWMPVLASRQPAQIGLSLQSESTQLQRLHFSSRNYPVCILETNPEEEQEESEETEESEAGHSDLCGGFGLNKLRLPFYFPLEPLFRSKASGFSFHFSSGLLLLYCVFRI